MSICNLISEEIEAIQRDELGIDNLDPEKYEIYLEKLNDQVKRLEKIKNILDNSNSIFEEYEKLLGNGLIDIKNLNLKNFASAHQEITENTLIFFGKLDFKMYEEMGHIALPKNLKFVVGTLLLNFTNIDKVELKYVSELHAQDSNNLRSISVEIINSLYLNRCSVLSSLKLLCVKTKITLIKLDQLNIESIESIYPNQPIEFGIRYMYSGDLKFSSLIKRT